MTTVIEDGGLPPDIIDEIKITELRSKGWGNPRITEEKLRDLIERTAANENLPTAANDPGPMEEVTVTGRTPVDPTDLARFLLTLLRRGGIGYLGAYDYPPWLEEALQNAVNEQTDQTLTEDDEIQEALLDPDPSPALIEEVKVYGEYTPTPDDEYTPTPDVFGTSFDYYDLSKEYRRATSRRSRMEHITVTAKRTKNAHIQTINFPWEFISTFPIARPHEIILPGYKPFPESLPEPFPEIAPGQPPKENPDTDPADDTLPGEAPFIQGNIELNIDPNNGVQLKIARQPARNREENKLRRDRKEQKASRAYRKVLLFVNQTYGELTELQDLWQVIAQNIYIDGKPLFAFDNPAVALLEADPSEIRVAWQNMMVDYAAMEAQDRLIGKMAQNTRHALNEMNYYGPNPGSFMPDPPSGP